MTATGPTMPLVVPIYQSRGSLLGAPFPIPCGKSARPTGRDIAVVLAFSNAGHPLDNKLLASLPRAHFDRLLPHLATIHLEQGAVMTEAGEEVDQIYFPHYGMLSLLAVLRDGKAIETATVGREGVVGAMAGLGLYKTLVRVVVQMPMVCRDSRHFGPPLPPANPSAISASSTVRYCCRGRGAAPAMLPRSRGAILPLAAIGGSAASDTVALTPILAETGVGRTSVTEVARRYKPRERSPIRAA